jgi:TolB-like protein
VVQAETSAAGDINLRAEDFRAQLDRILKSPDFEGTAREHRFLSHVVEETLAGRGSRIKAYSIAIEVFGRDASFDPQTDPVVRIEAGHLRRSLERYYLTAGLSDPILIAIPKGAYVPTFSSRVPPAAMAPQPIPVEEKAPALSNWRRASWLTVILSIIVAALAVLAFELRTTGVSPTAPEIPRLLVEKFEDLSGTEASAAIASGLAQEVIGQLSKFKDIVVVQSMEAVPDNSVTPPRFVLAGSVDLSADAFRLRVRFINRGDGSVLWADSYDGGMKVADLLDAEADIARNVATSLAQTYGVIFQADATLSVDNPPDDWAAYSCTLSYYAYRTNLDPKVRSEVRACLEKAVERFPRYATAWGLLALISIDEVRFRFPLDPASSPALFEHALAMARRAVELEPRNIRALHAEMSALFFSRQFDAGRKVGEQAMALNPNDTDLLSSFGTRLALSGSWDEGCPKLMEARERNPDRFGYYESILALCSYFHADNSQAVMWIKKTPYSRAPLYHLIAAAIFGEGGLKIDAERERVWLEENAPELVKYVRQEVSVRLGRSEDAEFFIGSLRKAGLDIKG